MDLKGHIKCARCRRSMERPVCQCGKTTCIIRFYWKGKYERRRDERGTVLTYPEALRILNLINTDMTVRGPLFDPMDWVDGAIKERRFENQIEEYYADKEKEMKSGELSPEYYRIIEGYNKKYFTYFHGMDIAQVSKKEVADFRRTLTVLPKIKSRQNVLSALKAFFNWLFTEGRIPSVPPFPAIKGNNSEQRRALRMEEQDELLEKVPADLRDPFVFAMETGVRAGELIAIQVKSVDVENRVVWIERSKSGAVYRETTKEGTKLPVPLNDKALEVVTRNIKGKFKLDYLFIYPKTGKPWSYKTLYKVWNDSTGGEYGIHESTRHSFCTQIVPLTDGFTAQRLMRHKDKRSTDRYYHAFSDRLLDVVQKKGEVVKLKAEEKE